MVLALVLLTVVVVVDVSLGTMAAVMVVGGDTEGAAWTTELTLASELLTLAPVVVDDSLDVLVLLNVVELRVWVVPVDATTMETGTLVSLDTVAVESVAARGGVTVDVTAVDTASRGMLKLPLGFASVGPDGLSFGGTMILVRVELTKGVTACGVTTADVLLLVSASLPDSAD